MLLERISITVIIQGKNCLLDRSDKMSEEILGKKEKEVVKEDVENMIIGCFKKFHNHGKLSDFMDDILEKLKEM